MTDRFGAISEGGMALEVNSAKYSRWALPHPMTLFWVLNPAAVFNELLLGQRLPKVTLIDRTSDRPLMERSFVPCPQCDAMHDGRIWGRSNAFGHWFGYICPDCGGDIPCLWSLTSLLVLAITAPVWVLPVRRWKVRWREMDRRRAVEARQAAPLAAAAVPWIRLGVFGFGSGMWLIANLVVQAISLKLERSFDVDFALTSLPVSLVSGVLWGLTMRHLMSRRPGSSALHSLKTPGG